MTVKLPSTGYNTIHSSVFSHIELRQVLSAYAEGVLSKNWKDYAITTEKNQTTFCVVERGQGVLYSISRTRSQKSSGQDFYRVFDGDRQIHRGTSFLEALAEFKMCGGPEPQNPKKLKVIKGKK